MGRREYFFKKASIGLPFKLYSDSNVVVSIAPNPIQHYRTKHIEIDGHS